MKKKNPGKPAGTSVAKAQTPPPPLNVRPAVPATAAPQSGKGGGGGFTMRFGTAQAGWLLFLVCVLLYGRTINNKYAMDDEIVTVVNPLTTGGLRNLPQILTTSYHNDAVNDYEYRPVVMVSFALEHQLFGVKPGVGHGINVLLYALSCLVLFRLCYRLWPGVPWQVWWCGMLLFAVHPLHSEVVCSLKNRDEILALLAALGALWFSLKYLDSNKAIHLAGVLTLFFVAVLSKRSVIPLALAFPVLIILFRKPTFRQYFNISILFIIPAVYIAPFQLVFLKITFAVLLFLAPLVLFVFFRLVDSRSEVSVASVWQMVQQTLASAWQEKLELSAGQFWLLIAAGLGLSILGVVFDARIATLLGLLLLLGLGVFTRNDSLRRSGFSAFVVAASTIGILFDLKLVPLPLFLGGWLWFTHEYGLTRQNWYRYLGIITLLAAVGLITPSAAGHLFAVAAVALLTAPEAHGKPRVSGFVSLFLCLALFALYIPLRETEQLFQGGVFLLYSLHHLHVRRFRLSAAQLGLVLPLLVAGIVFWGSYNDYLFDLQPVRESKDILLPESNRSLNYLENPLTYESRLWVKVVNGFYALAEYWKLFLWPAQLGFYYGFDQIPIVYTWFNGQVLASIVFHVGLALVFLWGLRRAPILSYCILHYAVCMSIFTSVGAPVPGIIAERLTYTASFGMCIGLVYAGYLLFRHFGLLVPGKLTWPVVVFAVITVAGFGRTYARTYDWYDHLTLYSHDTQHLTRSTQALQLLGNRIFTNALDESDSTRKQVLLREAMGHFRRSLEIRPTYYTSLMNMATVSQMLHLHDTAQVYFKKCLAYDPNDARNLFNLASSYQATGDTANAIKYYGLAIRTDKNLIVAYTNLSFLYFRRGQLDKSIQINEACLKQNPSEFHPYNNIGKTYFQLGKYELALRFFEKAFEIDPNGDENSLILVAESARRMGDLDKASKAVRLYRQRQAQQGKQIPPTLERQLLNRQ